MVLYRTHLAFPHIASYKHTCSQPSNPLASNTNTLRIRILRTTLPRRHLSRRPRKTRRDIQARIPHEKVSRPEQQRHGLSGHDGEIFGGWEVSDAECVPEDYVCVGDVFGRVVLNPFRDALRLVAACLGDVAAGGVEGVVVICGRELLA